MDERERAKLLERINRQGATVGESTPDTITVHGDELDLSEFLIETRKLEELPAETVEIVSEAKRVLREERATRVERIETDQLDSAVGERLASEVLGIDRALNALENVRQPSFGEQAQSAVIDDYERWLGFLDTINR